MNSPKTKVIQLVSGITSPINPKTISDSQLEKLMLDLMVTTLQTEMSFRNRILARKLGWLK